MMSMDDQCKRFGIQTVSVNIEWSYLLVVRNFEGARWLFD